jgi:PD-(D/E)XK nuclease superfamily
MYNRCSWQYYLRYIKGIKARPDLPIVVGTGTHLALEANARSKIRTGVDLPVHDLRDLTSDLLDAAISYVDPADLSENDNPGKAKDDAIAGVTRFRTEQAPAIWPIAVEWEFNWNIEPTDDLEYPIRVVNGRVDVIESLHVQRTGRVGVKDYKVTGRRKSQLEVDISPQLDLYDNVIFESTGKYPTEVGIRQFLPSNRTEGARAEQILRSADRMTPKYRAARRSRLIHTYQTTEKAIQTGIFLPVDDQRTCSWCGYRTQCQFSTAKDDYTAARIRQASQ